jgi:hypothetical protein
MKNDNYSAPCLRCGETVTFKKLIKDVSYDVVGTCECGFQMEVKPYVKQSSEKIVKKVPPAVSFFSKFKDVKLPRIEGKHIAIPFGFLVAILAWYGMYIWVSSMPDTSSKEITVIRTVKSASNGVVILDDNSIEEINAKYCEIAPGDYITKKFDIKYEVGSKKITRIWEYINSTSRWESCRITRTISQIDFPKYQKMLEQ